MAEAPEDKPFKVGPVGPDGTVNVYRTWTPEEWCRIPPDRRPPNAFQFGAGWAELIVQRVPDQNAGERP